MIPISINNPACTISIIILSSYLRLNNHSHMIPTTRATNTTTSVHTIVSIPSTLSNIGWYLFITFSLCFVYNLWFRLKTSPASLASKGISFRRELVL